MGLEDLTQSIAEDSLPLDEVLFEEGKAETSDSSLKFRQAAIMHWDIFADRNFEEN